MSSRKYDPHNLRSWFEDEGISISQWAASHGFKPQEVYALIAGKTRGVRGRAHKVAVALGLRPPPRGSARPIDTPYSHTEVDPIRVAAEGNSKAK